MQAALDVHYDLAHPRAIAAAVVFAAWTDASPAAEYTAAVENIAPHVPGQFFRRELPCLLPGPHCIPTLLKRADQLARGH